MLLMWLLYLEIQILESSANTSSDIHGVIQPSACRTERRMLLLYDRFKVDTCARCYHYMPSHSFKIKFGYLNWSGILRNPITNQTYEADPLNTSEGLLDSFSEELYVFKWRTCCFAAVECCDRMLSQPPPAADGAYCPRTWDGWQCWDDTPAGTTGKQLCQTHVYFQTDPPSCAKYSYKVCTSNGTWFMNYNNREWTNYSKCGRGEEYRRYLYFHIATYAISVVSMVPALIIFSLYKQLQVHRITMHKNLFLSLFLNGVVTLLFMSIVVTDEFNRSLTYESIIGRNGEWCKFLFILTKYFRSTNFMWMFCEGFYLHKLIAAAFAEQKTLVMFYLIGWVFPVIPVSIYAILRKILEDDKCWAFPFEPYEWIMNAPNMLSLVVNFFFLCNIIRVLVTKLRATHSNEPSQYRKAVRATLVLVPLFGLQFCLIIYRPNSGHCILLQMYTYFSHAMDGLQGFIVASIFCYMNGEVIYLLRRTYQRYRLRHHPHSRSQASIMLNPVSVTQVSTMGESQTAVQQGLHYRIKAGDRAGDAANTIPNSNSFQENSTTV